jgi:hypothetical protein
MHMYIPTSLMHQGLRDPGSRQGSGQTLESSDSGPGFRGSGTAGGCSAREVLPGVHTGTQTNRRDTACTREVKEECEEEEEAEQVQALRRAVVGHRPAVHLIQ